MRAVASDADIATDRHRGLQALQQQEYGLDVAARAAALQASAPGGWRAGAFVWAEDEG